MIKAIEDKLLEFLWGSGKRHAIAKDMIINHRHNFGLKFPCLSTKDESLKLSWVKRIIENEEPIISPFLACYMKMNIHLFFRCNLKVTDLNTSWYQKPSIFWQNVLSIWCKSNYRTAAEIEFPGEELLWFNSNIRINGSVVFFKTMHAKLLKGVLKVHDFKKKTEFF